MISLAEAQTRLLQSLPDIAIETQPFDKALGRWLANDLHAARTQPARDLSAMDGYAVKAGTAAQQWNIVGESAAGFPYPSPAGSGDAVRIFTGAALPDGTDSIIIQENVERNGTVIKLKVASTLEPGQNVRKRGSDFNRGALLLPAGTPVDARTLALAAMAGHDRLTVRRRLRMAMISTGDELVPPGACCDEDHIPASNGLMIAGMLANYPVDVLDLGIVPDREEALSEAIRRSRDCDLIVTIGGASVGDHDLVRPALLNEGARLDFWKVAMRPGKPLMAGRLGEALVIGLPGNPVSAYVTATLFVIPAIAAMSGAADPFPRRIPARLEAAMPPVGARTDHVRAKLTDSGVVPVGIDDSAALYGLARADALIVREAGSGAVQAGEMVSVILLS